MLSLLSTETILTASVESPLYGQSETLTATVASVSPGGETPTGTVTFYDGTTDLGTAVSVPMGHSTTATLTTSSLAVGTHAVTAVYSGDTNFAASSSGEIATVAGNGVAGYSGDGEGASGAMLNGPDGIAVDAQGDLFITDTSNNVVREVQTDGTILTVVGTGVAGYGGDGGPAAAAMLDAPQGLALNGQGDLFIADSGNNVVREVKPGTDGLLSDGTVTTVAGNGATGGEVYLFVYGNGGPATALQLHDPTGVAVNAQGDLFIAETDEGVIREVMPSGIITTFAGLGIFALAPLGVAYTGDGGPATDAALRRPTGVAVDSHGDVFIADSGDDLVREVRPDGTITTVAGTYRFQVGGYDGDGGPATAAGLDDPSAVAVDSAGDLFIADTTNNVIREVRLDGTITTVAGTGVGGYNGDDGPATAADMNVPAGVAVDGKGDLFIADSSNNRIRQVTGTLVVTVRAVATTTTALATTTAPVFGQPVTLTATISASSPGILFATGTVIFYDGTTQLGTASLSAARDFATASLTVASLPLGSHALVAVYSGDASFTESTSSAVPLSVQPDATTISVASTSSAPVSGQAVTFTATVSPNAPGAGSPTGTVTFYEANTALGTAALVTSDGTATATLITTELAVGLHSVWAVYGGDPDFAISNSRVISTIAGMAGKFGYSGDGGPATDAALNLASYSPFLSSALGGGGVSVDSQGDVFIADSGNSVIREVRPDGVITTVAGNGAYGYSGDGGPATAASLAMPSGVALDTQGDLFIADTFNNLIREVTPGPDGLLSDGIITTVAGNGAYGYSGDGDTAISGSHAWPTAVAVDAQGDLFIADTGNNVIREVTPGPDGILTAGTITTIAGNGTAGFSGDGGPASSAMLWSPAGVAVDSQGDVFIADSRSSGVREVHPDGAITTLTAIGAAIGLPLGRYGPGLDEPTGLAVDAQGNLFITDTDDSLILEVQPDGTTSVVAGDRNNLAGGYYGDGGPATSAGLLLPGGVAVDSAGNLFIADSYNSVVRRVGGLSLTVSAVTTSNLQVSLAGSGGALALQTFSSGDVNTAVQAISGVANNDPANPETVTLDLGGATATPTAPINASSGVQIELTSSSGNATVSGAVVSSGTVVIDSSVAPVDWTVNGGNVTVEGSASAGDFIVNGGTVTLADGTVITGNSPAIIVNGGTVILQGVIARTATNSPTIVVNSGSLVVRNSTVQESTGYSQAAILINGGTVDLGISTSPGGNTLNVNGAGTLIVNTNGNSVSTVGDTFTINGAAPAPSSLSGLVFSDFNHDGQVDFGEQGIAGVTITLDGTDFVGGAVHLSQATDAAGTYVFQNLLPGTYTITEPQQPVGYSPGINSTGTGGGTVSLDQFDLYLAAGLDAMNYNYGAQPAASGAIVQGQTAGIGFWNNKNGQALIKALNGGAGTKLGDWLAATFPHIFGALAGSDDLAGESNACVAAFFQSRFVVHDQKLDAQVLATALAVYVTDPTLDSTGVGTQYGFKVASNGVATATVSVGSNGAAFGVANNTSMTVLDLLVAADAQAVNGVLYNGNTTKRNLANSVFSAINDAGGL